MHHNSLGPAIQPVLYPVKSTPIQAMSSQFLQEKLDTIHLSYYPEGVRHQEDGELRNRRIKEINQDTACFCLCLLHWAENSQRGSALAEIPDSWDLRGSKDSKIETKQSVSALSSCIKQSVMDWHSPRLDRQHRGQSHGRTQPTGTALPNLVVTVKDAQNCRSEVG
ncbi:hypothetical protein QYF61_015392 [Mycteria americana]|uniref:Uncharacterized protein n=1 Tax=Mycteria americana TaxID=33587 RepID=A0AAN7N2D7_MYCAM|nr:hypothetical protein QYF61_015392 [Mycteria americana]